MRLEKYKKCSLAAMKKIKADLVIKNAKIVNVFTNRIEENNIAITNDMIVGIGNFEGEKEINVHGQYVTSGFIDAHLHLESTMVNPQVLISRAARHGTTTFIVDPHEAANVSGSKGVDYLLDQTKNSTAHVYVMLASCVPAAPFEDNGAIFTSKEMEPYVKNRRVLGLGEIMDHLSVINSDPEMNAKFELFDGKIKDGHAPNLSDTELAAYVLAGVTTDHEGTSYEYIMKERAIGMTCHIREGSAARNEEAIIKGIIEHNDITEGFCFCTDDKHIEDIEKEGHINFNVKKAVRLGIDPVEAIKMATIHPARCYGLRRTGAIAPGYDADIVVWDSLKDFNAQIVFYNGIPIDNVTDIYPEPCSEELMDTVHVGEIDPEKLKIKIDGKKFPVIKAIPGEILTKKVDIQLPGTEYFEPNEKINKIAVFERHKATGKCGVGAITGLGIKGGAIASSVSHDSHNIIAIGDNDEDIIKAVKEIERAHGGYTIVENGQVFETLELPVMGLISDKSYDYVSKQLNRMIAEAHMMGVPKKMDPFITLSFMALPVIPELRCTTRGIYSVPDRKFLNQEEN